MTTYSWSLEKGFYPSRQIVSNVFRERDEETGNQLGGRPPSLSRFGLVSALHAAGVMHEVSQPPTALKKVEAGVRRLDTVAVMRPVEVVELMKSCRLCAGVARPVK